MKYLITYTTDNNATQHQQTITAANYTDAYLQFTFNNTKQTIILEITNII